MVRNLYEAPQGEDAEQIRRLRRLGKGDIAPKRIRYGTGLAIPDGVKVKQEAWLTGPARSI